MLKVLIPLLILSILSWVYQDAFLKPCTRPISYYVHSIDTRFGLDQKDFVEALNEAEGVWEREIGIDLFRYSSDEGNLPVNLVYDYRQETTNELAHIGEELEYTESAYNLLEKEYSALKVKHRELESSYRALLASFNQHNARYEQKVDEWNSSNRTDKSKFADLERERISLESEFVEIKSVESELNNIVKKLNMVVDRLNRLARELNLDVETYNTLGASRGDTFTGGLYTDDSSGRRIDIFEFENKAKLVRVLAHEFGHALGLEHVDDPEAIMYYLNEGTTSRLSSKDLKALKELCGIE